MNLFECREKKTIIKQSDLKHTHAQWGFSDCICHCTSTGKKEQVKKGVCFYFHINPNIGCLVLFSTHIKQFKMRSFSQGILAAFSK